MRASLLSNVLAAAAAVLWLTGCVEHRVYVHHPPPPVVQPAPEVVVTEPPPPPQREVVVASPGPEYVWAPGYWSWNGRWVWVGGRYVVRPHHHAHWVPGHWAHRHHEYVWVPGHWR